MKRYSEYKDSGVEWIGEIPSHWEVKRLKNIVESIRNGTSAQQVDYDTNYKVTRIETISNGTINYEKTGNIDAFKGIEQYKLNQGDILFSNINSLEMVGNIAIYEGNENLYSGMNLLRIIAKKDINKKWLYFLIKSKYFKKSVESIAKHAINQVSVSTTNLKSINVCIPPRQEQDKIVKYLEKKTLQLDNLISKKEELIETLKISRSKLISETVTKGLDKNVPMKDSKVEWIGDIPSHWECNVFKRIIKDIKDGTHGTHLRVAEGEYLLSAKNLNNNYIEINESDSRISYKDYKQIVSNGFPKKNDILLSTVGSIGRSCVYEMNKPIAFQRSVTFIRLKNNNNPYFYRYFIESKVYQNQLNSYAKTSAQSGIYMGDILKTTVLSVPLDEQNNIVNYLNEQLKRIDNIIQIIKEQIKILKKAKQKLITEVVTGKIDVTNL